MDTNRDNIKQHEGASLSTPGKDLAGKAVRPRTQEEKATAMIMDNRAEINIETNANINTNPMASSSGQDMQEEHVADAPASGPVSRQASESSHPPVNRHAEMMSTNMDQAMREQWELQGRSDMGPDVTPVNAFDPRHPSRTSLGAGMEAGADPSPASASRTSSTMAGPAMSGPRASGPRASDSRASGSPASSASRMSSTPMHAGPRSSGAIGNIDDSNDLSAPVGNDRGFGFRHFPGLPHMPRTAGSARFNTTNVNTMPGTDPAGDATTSDEDGSETDEGAARTRALMLGREPVPDGGRAGAARNADSRARDHPGALADQAQAMHVDGDGEGQPGQGSAATLAKLPAGVRVELGAPGASNEQRAGERDWACAGQNTEFLAWKDNPAPAPALAAAAPVDLCSPRFLQSGAGAGSGPGSGLDSPRSLQGARRSGSFGPISSGLLNADMQAGPEDCVVAPDAAITNATVPVDHMARDRPVSPDALRHEQMRGVLGQEISIHAHEPHFYNTDPILPSNGDKSPKKRVAEAGTCDAAGGVNKPDSEVTRDPCHLAMGQ